jgi:hypothetical protein
MSHLKLREISDAVRLLRFFLLSSADRVAEEAGGNAGEGDAVGDRGMFDEIGTNCRFAPLPLELL